MIRKKIPVPYNKHSVRRLFPAILMLLCFVTGVSFAVYVRASDPSPAKQEGSTASAAITEYEPALAVRAAGCITCHAKIKSNIVTDFGYGNRYFFGNPGGGGKLGPFSGHTYGDFYGGEKFKTAWLTAEIDKEIIVPHTRLDFDLQKFAGTELADQSNYAPALQAKSLAGYLQAVEDQKANPASVIEKEKVFIGAPDAAALEERFNIGPGSNTNFKYLKNDDAASPDISGIALSNSKAYYTNTGEVVCDGDLFVRGILFLDQPAITTNHGCRIYATGPIFLQGAIVFHSLNRAADETNLQMVSSEAILLGIGDKNCTSKTYADPLSTRFHSSYALSSFITRQTDSKSISPETEAQNIYDQAKLIPSREDASCHDDTIEFSRILLNAPQIHSRYRGTFKGIVIAEFALFRQGNSSFEFDPVFKKVPVLPLLKKSDYLLIE